ncbi:MAG TPA: efflux RND transporter permease subunit [Candidatus Acidoferrales bacterium]|nr:efflux RND transporter permease subunit [Candidatus Acidoferrales bacterium]
MWIVRIALRRPYTFIVAAILILILGLVAISRTPVDIFPDINIPVVSIIWGYTGLSPEDMSNRIIYGYERGVTTTVNDIEHIESQSYTGIGVVKVFFQPGADITSAVAQVTSVAQSALRRDPPGTVPPFIIAYNASTVPILQLALSGAGLSEQELNDASTNFIRPGLVTVHGAVLPASYGGKERQIQVDLNIPELQARGLSANDVVSAISAQNLILPGGTAKIGPYEYQVDLNESPAKVNELNNLPIKTVNGSTIYVRDVAHVRDGFPPQTNIVRVDGSRSVLMSVLKSGGTSTLDIISSIKAKLPAILADSPDKINVHLLADQSIFVRASVDDVIREGAIAAILTGLMILVFLGSWRSTLIIAISIPLSVLCSIIVLSALGESINIMTLGGLALAVGILVDDSTVTIENIHRNIDEGKEITQAILDGASQIAVPALVSTLSICIVFVPMFFLSGVARYLFVPLAEAVVFAMLASYLLSRTLVPTMARYLLVAQTAEEHSREAAASRNPFVLIQLKFERGFQDFQNGYRGLLDTSIRHRKLFVALFFPACILSFALLPFVGQDFFPSVDSGEFKFHVRAPTGTRIEDTAALCGHIEDDIRRLIPPSEMGSIIDNIGLPYSGINLSYSTTGVVGPEDADIQVELASGHRPTKEYVTELRAKLNQDFPGVMFYALPVDIVSQILNFGLPAPIDIQVVGRKLALNHEFAEKLLNQLKFVPGTVDLRIQQPFNYPKLYIEVDRTKADQVGLTERDVATNLLVSLSGSFETSPSFWVDPESGISYSVATQSPQYNLNSLQDLENIPISGGNSPTPQILAGLASITPSGEMAVVSHYDIEPVIDIYGSVEGRDLGGVSRDIMPIINRAKKDLPEGTQLMVRGQIQTMNSSFNGLLAGLGFSILLVYLLIVINFQSWLDPFIILMALPAALAGIVWFLFVTGTTISVPALTGAIMCMGVGTANSILVVSFSKELLEAGKTPSQAALEAGFTRFRPVLMTALAMIIGMLPMSLGLGQGGEQNAPLGRAVIGGLLFATVATLFFVPVFFSFVHSIGRRGPSMSASS